MFKYLYFCVGMTDRPTDNITKCLMVKEIIITKKISNLSKIKFHGAHVNNKRGKGPWSVNYTGTQSLKNKLAYSFAEKHLLCDSHYQCPNFIN